MKKNKFIVFVFAVLAVFFVFNLLDYGVVFSSVDNITQIVFKTEPQTISPGVVSSMFTIQTQNSSGDEEKIDESSNKMNLSVNSSTGEFNSNNNTWAPVNVLTMNKNTANKNFYYKDTSTGTFTITANLVSGETGKIWTTTQNIKIGESGADDEGDTGTTTATTTTATGTTTATTTTITGGTRTVYSVHYIQEEISNYVEPTFFEISAGRNRLSYVNSPISFEAKKKVSTNLKKGTPKYFWSFGDGSFATNEKAVHTYKYPGEYNVVLNASLPDHNSVSRTKVKVLAPNLTLSVLSDGAIQIFNKGNDEVNLYGWKVLSGREHFDFPLDTIISAGQKITFPIEYLKIPVNVGETILTDSSGKNISQAGPNALAINSDQIISVADFQKFTLEYNRLTNNQPRTFTAVVSPPSTIAPTANLETIADSPKLDIPMTAAVADSIIENEASTPGFWSKLFHPIRTVKEAFYD